MKSKFTPHFCQITHVHGKKIGIIDLLCRNFHDIFKLHFPGQHYFEILSQLETTAKSFPFSSIHGSK